MASHNPDNTNTGMPSASAPAAKGPKRGYWHALVVALSIALVIVPPIAGFVVLAVVLSGTAADAVMNSGAATSVALLVGAMLVLVPPALYAANPRRYLEHQAAVESRMRELWELRGPSARSSTEMPPGQQEHQLEPGAPDH